jgi:hypothetical protein
VSGQTQHLWIYAICPVLGALLAVPLCWITREGECCGAASTTSLYE